MQMLFQWDLGQHPPAEVISTFLDPRKLEPDTAAFARLLFEGAVKEVDALDSTARAHARHWRLERMAAVDRNIIRMALYEILHVPENPPAVVINEALELARRFSSVDSVDFINGVLDSARKGSSARR